MGYIAFIDYEHLDNSLFLKALAGGTASQGHRVTPRIFVHGDSEYTERLIQTGMMRKDASFRAIKELNRRLVALFADYGVSAIGLNGYQRKVASYDPESDKLTIDHQYLLSLPSVSIVIISNLVHVVGQKKPQLFPVDRYLASLASVPGVTRLYAFSSAESPSEDDKTPSKVPSSPENEKKDSKKLPPHELIDKKLDSQIISLSEFSQVTD